MDNLHRHIPVEVLKHLRGDVVAPGWFRTPRNDALAPYAPPTDFLALLRRECRDAGLTSYMTLPDEVWWLAADGHFNALPGIAAPWNRSRRAVVPMLRFERADGSHLVGHDIQNMDYQREAVAFAVRASATVRGGREVMRDIADETIGFIRKVRAESGDEIGQRIKALPWHLVSRLRSEFSDSTRIRAERIADARVKEKFRQMRDEIAEEPAQVMRRQIEAA